MAVSNEAIPLKLYCVIITLYWLGLFQPAGCYMFHCNCMLLAFLVYYVRPAGLLVVPGPGLIHALAGMANAAVNCW